MRSARNVVIKAEVVLAGLEKSDGVPSVMSRPMNGTFKSFTMHVIDLADRLPSPGFGSGAGSVVVDLENTKI